jgi:hypothetical protein
VAHELEHRRGEHDLLAHHHGVHVVREWVRHRCICVEPELALRLYMNVVRELERRLDVRVVGDLVLRRYICVVRELDAHLHNDRENRESRMAFRHPCVVVCRKDSKHHYCA